MSYLCSWDEMIQSPVTWDMSAVHLLVNSASQTATPLQPLCHHRCCHGVSLILKSTRAFHCPEAEPRCRWRGHMGTACLELLVSSLHCRAIHFFEMTVPYHLVLNIFIATELLSFRRRPFSAVPTGGPTAAAGV